MLNLVPCWRTYNVLEKTGGFALFDCGSVRGILCSFYSEIWGEANLNRANFEQQTKRACYYGGLVTQIHAETTCSLTTAIFLKLFEARPVNSLESCFSLWNWAPTQNWNITEVVQKSRKEISRLLCKPTSGWCRVFQFSVKLNKQSLSAVCKQTSVLERRTFACSRRPSYSALK